MKADKQTVLMDSDRFKCRGYQDISRLIWYFKSSNQTEVGKCYASWSDIIENWNDIHVEKCIVNMGDDDDDVAYGLDCGTKPSIKKWCIFDVY